jgi:predicted GNAT family acetyltransferase
MPLRILRLARELIHPKPVPLQNVASGRIEIERDGYVAFLEYTLGGDVLALIHTEVPKEVRHLGLASALAERALNWAREKGYKVDVICPFVREYIDKHPEYADLVMK